MRNILNYVHKMMSIIFLKYCRFYTFSIVPPCFCQKGLVNVAQQLYEIQENC